MSVDVSAAALARGADNVAENGFGGKVFFIVNAPLKGDTFRFGGLERLDGKGSGITLSGSVKGDVIEGVIHGDELPGESIAWTAQRDPSTVTSLAQ